MLKSSRIFCPFLESSFFRLSSNKLEKSYTISINSLFLFNIVLLLFSLTSELIFNVFFAFYKKKDFLGYSRSGHAHAVWQEKLNGMSNLKVKSTLSAKKDKKYFAGASRGDSLTSFDFWDLPSEIQWVFDIFTNFC